MFGTSFTNGLLIAAKLGIAKHSGEIITAGKGLAGKAADTAVVAAPYVVPGVAAGVVGGAAAHVICDNPQNRAMTGAVLGGLGGAAAGYVTGGPIGAATNGVTGAFIGTIVGSHEF